MNDATPLLGAFVTGRAASVLAPLLDEHLPDRLVRLSLLVEKGRLDPEWLSEVNRAYAAIREAARVWRDVPAAVAATADQVTAAARDFDQGEISTEAAADLLNVTPNRVRQLLRTGVINGRHVGRTWFVDLDDVKERRGRDGGGRV